MQLKATMLLIIFAHIVCNVLKSPYTTALKNVELCEYRELHAKVC